MNAVNEVVLVSQDEFNSWKETIYLLGNPANAANLRKQKRMLVKLRRKHWLKPISLRELK